MHYQNKYQEARQREEFSKTPNKYSGKYLGKEE